MKTVIKPATSIQAHIGRVKYRTVIITGKHTLIIDEPESAGGADTGPGPGSLLLASLASCTAITLRMYVDRKMWAVADINVNSQMLTNDAGNMIKLGLSYTGELTEEQRTRLLQIANSCPIHKILAAGITIETAFE